MADMTREDLERQAMESVCSCWAYDLPNDIETIPDAELLKIIAHPTWPHVQNQIHNPVSNEEFIEELQQCTDYNLIMRKAVQNV